MHSCKENAGSIFHLRSILRRGGKLSAGEDKRLKKHEEVACEGCKEILRGYFNEFYRRELR